MRVLVVANMQASEANPALGAFVHSQVDALRARGDVEVDLFTFAPGNGSPASYLRAARDLRRLHPDRYDVVHAHFGLSAWTALAARARVRVMTMHGNDLHHPRSRLLTRAALGRYDLVATVSSELAGHLPGAGVTRPVAVLPCGVDLERFKPMDRVQARERLGLDPEGRYLLFCHDPARPDKRHDLALDVAGDTTLLTLGAVAPADVPLWHNAANAVLVPSDKEGFGLAVLEALACDVPVVATRTGVHSVAIDGVPGCLCADYDQTAWRATLAPHLAAADPRVPGRARAQLFSADLMAARVVAAWRELLPEQVASTTLAPPDGAV